MTISPRTDSTEADLEAGNGAADATQPEADPELDATAAKLAEADTAAFRAKGPRIDTKVTGLLSLMASLLGVTGLLGTLATIRARQTGAPVAAVLISAAAAVLCLGFVIRRAGLVLIAGIALALAGGLAYSWGW